MDAVASPSDVGAAAPPVTWLSGGIVTVINKIGPVLWLAAVIGGLSGIYFSVGNLSVGRSFGPLVGFFALATIFIVWLGMRIQRVGYSGRELIVSNYLRQERIPFDQVEAAEPVWWYYRRMVRVRFRTHTSFGYAVYYVPKWAAIKCFWVAPEKELQELLLSHPEVP